MPNSGPAAATLSAQQSAKLMEQLNRLMALVGLEPLPPDTKPETVGDVLEKILDEVETAVEGGDPGAAVAGAVGAAAMANAGNGYFSDEAIARRVSKNSGGRITLAEARKLVPR